MIFLGPNQLIVFDSFNNFQTTHLPPYTYMQRSPWTHSVPNDLSATVETCKLHFLDFRQIYQEASPSSASDVWSFGILLWEIATLGDIPYPDVPGIEKLIRDLKQGKRMDKPVSCSEQLFQLMLRCWEEIPARRPDFVNLTQQVCKSSFVLIWHRPNCPKVCFTTFKSCDHTL